MIVGSPEKIVNVRVMTISDVDIELSKEKSDDKINWLFEGE